MSDTLVLHQKPRLWVSIALCVVLILAMGRLRLVDYAHTSIPIGFGVPIVIAGWTRRRRLIWSMVVIFFLMTVVKIAFINRNSETPWDQRIINITLLLGDTLLVAGVVDMLVQYQETLELRGQELRQRNQEISASREEISRQNEELQAQTEELERQSEELRVTNEELDHRRRIAEEASERKSRFLAAVSHDIRTPANAISLLAELIQRSAKSPDEMVEIPELANELKHSSMSLVSLVSDVLDLNRLDAGRVELNENEFDVAEWLSEECRQLLPLAEQKHLRFEFHSVDSLRLRGDRIKLSRVLVNLVGNAIKFTETGQVHVSAEKLADGRPKVVVRDTGIGIASEHLSRIFDEFYQLKNPGRERGKGSGLGLSISKRLIEVMGGQMEVTSTPGKGSVFSFTLPASCLVR